MRDSEVVHVLASLAAAFPRQELAAETLEVYARDLADLDARVAAAAVERLRKSSRFFPTIAEVREQAAEVMLGAPAPMAAYGQVVAWVKRQRPLSELHPTVREAVRMVGDAVTWREEPAWQLRRLFLESYRELKASAVADIVAPAAVLSASTSLPSAVSVVAPELPSVAG